jgi:uncharacterized protein YecE (DUF72 family)
MPLGARNVYSNKGYLQSRYAVEVRHSSWFQDLAYSFFANNELCLVWSQLAELQTPPILITDFLYLRFTGDRSLQEKYFGRIQLERVLEVQKWADNIRAVQHERIKLILGLLLSNKITFRLALPKTRAGFRPAGLHQ